MPKKLRNDSPHWSAGDDPIRELDARAKANDLIYARAIGLTEEIKDSRASRKAKERRALTFWTPLMDQLEARTGRKIKNRRKFCYEISFHATIYKYEKACDEGPTAKQVRIGYEKMVEYFDAFRLEFEGALHMIPTPLSVPLILAMRPDGSGDRYSTDDGFEHLKRIREDLDRYERLVHEALEYARNGADHDRRGGSRRRFAMDSAIRSLGELYKRTIDRDWGVSGEEKDGGPFVDFVRNFLAIIDPVEKKDPHKLERPALYQTIKKIRRERKAIRARRKGCQG